MERAALQQATAAARISARKEMMPMLDAATSAQQFYSAFDAQFDFTRDVEIVGAGIERVGDPSQRWRRRATPQRTAP